MSSLIEKWSQQLGRDAAEEALRRHPEIAEMNWQEQEALLEGLERLHENQNVPVTIENSERLYGYYFKEEPRPTVPKFEAKSAAVEADFFNDPATSAEDIKRYFQQKHGAR
jgi:hypothetical protein